jgi:hypothetical protein
VKISQLRNIDIATLHLYERHMEELPPPDLHWSWLHCNFSCMMDWMPKYLQVVTGWRQVTPIWPLLCRH